MTFSLFAIAMSSALVIQSPRGKTELTVQGATVSIDYGRPSLNSRDMLSLLPVGYVWRLGADEATVIKTSHDFKFDDVAIPAGSYSLFVERAGEHTWKLVFNTETGQWGTQHDVTMDFANAPLKASKSDIETEQLTIELNEIDAGGELQIRWGAHILSLGLQRR